VGVPLSVAGRQLGVLAIADPSHGTFTPQDVMLVEGLASQLSLIVDNARLREIPSPLRAIAGGA
jgi:GAF domain-containing protein